MSGKPTLSADERRKATYRRSKARHKQRQAAEMILAKATVQAHRMLGAAIEKARQAGIADPESLIAVYIAEIAKAKAAEEAWHAAMEAAAEGHGVDPEAVQSAYIAATPKPKRQVRGGQK